VRERRGRIKPSTIWGRENSHQTEGHGKEASSGKHSFGLKRSGAQFIVRRGAATDPRETHLSLFRLGERKIN